ncbi:sn-glycerol-1-phosphate dehydrogenase [Nigerium massiliense]|uniref:sn-glycerol-1-phosphate dehydrogenase n=1 Tax=Nigerium massiliense TaxID=1522317 RepID=UPI00058EDC34|nr:sn-glycerol-1-phosphate dehydrogenase [Nigerium massiliense]
MSNEQIDRAVAKAKDTDVVEVGRGLLPDSGRVIADGLLRQGKPAMLVADGNTWDAAGAAVERSSREAGADLVEPLIYPAKPTLYAAYERAEEVRDRLRETGSLGVAIGSGTLNDIVKLASGELDQPYAVVGTAASMDGYSGFGAPMTRDGIKITMPCPAPKVVVFDVEVAAGAPTAMAASGYGDLSAKIPAGADWILADAAGVDPIDPLAWELVQSGVREALSRPAELAAGVPDAFEGLCSGLVLSGLAMQVAQGTRPASGAEHYFSHLWELDHLGADQDPPLSHGFKVAIGTLAMTAFYEAFLRRDLSRVDLDAVVDRWPSWEQVAADINATMTGPLIQKGLNETKEKYVDAAGLRVRLGRLRDAWSDIRPRLDQQLMPARELQRMLGEAGAPTRPEDIGLTADDVRQTFPRAMYYRSRYTVLDVARELGWFDEIVTEMFAPGGLWS